MFKLFHNDALIGTISNAMPDEMAMAGDILLTAAAARFDDLFRFLSDEKNYGEDPPFEDALLEGWQIENERGERFAIFVPTIYPDGTICWR